MSVERLPGGDPSAATGVPQLGLRNYWYPVLAGWRLRRRPKTVPSRPMAGFLSPARCRPTRRVIENLKLVLAGAGSALDQIVFARVCLTHFERDYAPMNRVYQSYFAPDRLSARTCVGVTGLARGALVEIDLLARQRN